jgi:large subunit ribosomal protein L16
MAKQIPARVKYRKMHRGSRAGIAWKGSDVSFGEYGLQALDRAWITTRQIEACRQTITRKMKRRGKVWIRIFPHKSYTKKPLEVRMGKGKAAVEGWVAVVRPATMLFEISGVSEGLAKEALALAAAKLPIKTRLIRR